MLLARGARGDDLLPHAGVDREPRAVRGSAVERIRPGRAAAGQDLVSRLRLRRQGHHLAVGDRAGLAGEPEALLHLLVAELEGVLHGGRRDVAGEDLAPAAPASAARAAGGVHGDARRPAASSSEAPRRMCARRTAFAIFGVDEARRRYRWRPRLFIAFPCLAVPEPPSKCRCRVTPSADRPAAPNPAKRSDPGRLPSRASRALTIGCGPAAGYPLRASDTRHAGTLSLRRSACVGGVDIALTPTPPAAPPRASARASPPAPRRGPSRRRRTRRPIPGWSARRPPGSSPCRGVRP